MLQKQRFCKVYMVTMVLCALILTSSFLFYHSAKGLLHNNYATVYATTQSSDEFLKYDNRLHGIEIQYPSAWGKMEGPLLDRFRTNNSMPIVGFCSPDVSVSLMVATGKLQKNITLDQDLKETISNLEKSQPGFKLIESNKTTLANLPAYKVLYNGTFDFASTLKKFPELAKIWGNLIDLKPVDMTSLLYMTIRDGDEYVLGYSDGTGKSVQQLPRELRSLSNINAACPSSSGSSSGTSGNLGDLGDLGDLGAILGPGLKSSQQSPPVIPDAFSHYLPIAQKMIDSFSFNNSPQKAGQEVVHKNQSISISDDPVLILKKRLASGEISIEKYNELLKIITSR
jgi:hypothetical protein